MKNRPFIIYSFGWSWPAIFPACAISSCACIVLLCETSSSSHIVLVPTAPVLSLGALLLYELELLKGSSGSSASYVSPRRTQKHPRTSLMTPWYHPQLPWLILLTLIFHDFHSPMLTRGLFEGFRSSASNGVDTIGKSAKHYGDPRRELFI